METYLKALCHGSELIVIRTIFNENEICGKTDYLIKLSPLGKQPIQIPYFSCYQSEGYEKVRCERKKALYKLSSALKTIGFESREKSFESLISGATNYIILSRQRDISCNRILYGMIREAVTRRHLTPTHINIKRGFSYMDIDVTTSEPLSRIKALHIQYDIENALYCRASLTGRTEHTVSLSAREVEPRHVGYKELYNSLDWNDECKILLGIDIDNNPISIDMAENKKILWFHGENNNKISVINFLHNKYLYHYSELSGRELPLEFLETLNPCKGKVIVISITSSKYIYNPAIIRALNRLLSREDITVIIETNTLRIIEKPLSCFDCKIITGLDKSLEARHLADFCGTFNNHFYDTRDMILCLPEKQTYRCEALTYS